MRRSTRWIAGGALAVALGAGGAGIASGTGGGDDDGSERPIAGTALERASAAALRHTGGGEVTETEMGDEEGYYEVEVTLGGAQVDVHLDRDFRVIGDEADAENPDESAKG